MQNAPIFLLNPEVSRAPDACAECSLLKICYPIDNDGLDGLRIKRSIKKLGPYRRGEHVFRRGDRFFAVYAVRDGSLKRVIADQSGRERVTSFHFKGEVFGFDAISIGRHASDCIALERTSLCALPYDALRSCGKDYPQLYNEIIHMMSDEILRQLSTTPTYSAKERTAAFLLALADRFAKTNSRVDKLDVTMNRQDIAYYLAITPETLSRVFSEFKSRRIIETNGKNIRLLSRARLKSLIERG